MTTTHRDLIEASQAVGAIAESSEWYTKRLAQRIAENGGVHRMTVSELIDLDRDLRQAVARAYMEAWLC